MYEARALSRLAPEPSDSESYDEETLRIQGHPAARWIPRRPWVLALGAAALLGCVGLAAQGLASGGAQDAPPPQHISARMLFEDPEVKEVATAQVMRAGNGVLGPEDESLVRKHVHEGFSRFADEVRTLDPTTYRILEEVQLDPEQRRAVLRAMSLATDPRVQRLGLEVANAVRESGKTEDNDALQKRILEKLRPHLEESREVIETVVPRSLQGAIAQGEPWKLQLDARRIQQMKTSDGSREISHGSGAGAPAARRLQSGTPAPYTSLPPLIHSAENVLNNHGAVIEWTSTTVDPKFKPVVMSEKILGIIGAVSEEMRCVLDIVRPLSKMFGKDLNVPPEVTTAIGAADAVFQLTDCCLDAATGNLSMEKMMVCPMEIGTEGMDALRLMFSFVGVLGDNNPKNGIQGNHNGMPTEDTNII